jgi:hypothetical protein
MKMEKLKDDLKWAFKLYSLTAVIPLVLTALLLIVGILGKPDLTYGFFGTLKMLWVDYYFTGYFLTVIAWRWQLVIFLIAFLLVKMEKTNETNKSKRF